MTKHRTQVLLEPMQFERLARQARQKGVSVSELLRKMVERELEGDASTKPDLAAIRGIFSAPSMTNAEIDAFLYGAEQLER